MHIRACVRNTPSRHLAEIATDGAARELAIPAKSGARGSGANGGELLMLALATCYCNDLFREAARLDITLDEVEVAASADFPGVGLAAENIRYAARISSSATKEQIERLLATTDQVAEIHNTVRAGTPVTLEGWT